MKQKLIFLFIFILAFSTAFSESTHKLAKKAEKLYNESMFDDALKVCEQILSDAGEDATTLGDKASASWIRCWVYKFYKNYDP